MFAVKRALKLNDKEATLMAKHAGFRRVIFNRGLSLRVQIYGEGEFSDSKVIKEVKKVLTNHVKKQSDLGFSDLGFSDLGFSDLGFSDLGFSDLGFSEFRRQIEYKCQMYGANLVLVDRWFPSCKICANCGHKKDMPLSIRTYDCPACGVSADRDLNASLNILNWEPKAIGG
jgi:Putative transposase DNA-binding domain/Helix-turn-helix domain